MTPENYRPLRSCISSGWRKQWRRLQLRCSVAGCAVADMRLSEDDLRMALEHALEVQAEAEACEPECGPCLRNRALLDLARLVVMIEPQDYWGIAPEHKDEVKAAREIVVRAAQRAGLRDE